MTNKTILRLSITALSIAIIGVIALYLTTSKQELGKQAPRSLAQLGGDFTLRSVDGNVSLDDYRGQTVVMYFGFMTCPEVCPNSLGVIKQAFNKLQPEQLDVVKGIMVSIDPQRDSLQALKAFAHYFHPNIAGITGNQQQLMEVATQYGAYFAKTKDQRSGYLFEHSSRYYVIDKNGVLVDAMRHSTTANELAARLKTTI